MNHSITTSGRVAAKAIAAFAAAFALIFSSTIPASATSSSSATTSSVTALTDNANTLVEATQFDSAGNMYVAGYTTDQIMVGKYASSGAQIWLKYLATGGAQDLALDPFGNIFISGWFCGSVDLGALLGTMTSVGTCDGFVLKLDNDGNATEASKWGMPTGSDGSSGVTADSAGNVYVAADVSDLTTEGAAGIGGITWTSNVPAGADPQGEVIVKYNNSLDTQSVKPLPNGFLCEHTGHAFDVSRTGKLLVGGYLDNTTDFGTFGSYPVTSSERGAWLELDSQGNIDQVQVYSGDGWQEVTGASYDQAGNIYILGLFAGNTTISGTSLPDPSATAGFALKLDSTGMNLSWINSWHASSQNDVYAFNMAVDQAGNLALTGFFQFDLLVGDFPVVTAEAPGSVWQSFALGINADGSFAWLKTTKSATAYAIQFGRPALSASKFATGGTFSGPLDFGDGVTADGTNAGFVWSLSLNWANSTPLPAQQAQTQQVSVPVGSNVPKVRAIEGSVLDSRKGGDITISGTGMAKVTAVLMGSLPLIFKVVDDFTLTVTMPPHAAGPADLIIKTAAGALAFDSAANYSDTFDTHFASPVLTFKSVGQLKSAIAKLTTVAYVDCEASYGSNNATAKSMALAKARNVCAAAGLAAPGALLTSTAIYVKGSTIKVGVTITGRAKN